MTELRDNIFAIEVPNNVSVEGYTYNRIYTGGGEYEFHSWPYNELPPIKTGIKKDEYSYIFQSKQYTEDQAAIVVEMRELAGEGNYSYVNYDFEGDRIAFFLTAIESMESLLKSKGLTAENYLIIKKVES